MEPTACRASPNVVHERRRWADRLSMTALTAHGEDTATDDELNEFRKLAAQRSHEWLAAAPRIWLSNT